MPTPKSQWPSVQTNVLNARASNSLPRDPIISAKVVAGTRRISAMNVARYAGITSCVRRGIDLFRIWLWNLYAISMYCYICNWNILEKKIKIKSKIWSNMLSLILKLAIRHVIAACITMIWKYLSISTMNYKWSLKISNKFRSFNENWIWYC